MPVAGAIIAGATSVGSGMIASKAAKKASKVQDEAARRSEALQREMFERQVDLQEPFRQAGMTAQNRLMELLGIGGNAGAADYGSAAQAFGMDQFQQDPGYAFRQAEGMKALERSAAARGNLLSGATMKGIQRYGQDLASQEYQNAFNRYQVERAARLNPLQSMMGSGQSAANTLTSAAGNLGQGLSNAAIQSGQARASGYIGSANALSGALSSLGQSAMGFPLYQAQTNYLNSMAQRGGGSGGGGAASGSSGGGGIFGNFMTPFLPGDY